MACIRCGNKIVENQETGLCGSCGADDRKAERQAMRDSSKPKPKRIPRISKKHALALKEYSGPGGTREQHLKDNPFCQIMLVGCEKVGTSVHHCAKRGKNLNKKEYFKTACDYCHNFIERVMSAKERRERGFLI